MNGIAANFSLGSCNSPEFYGDNYTVIGYVSNNIRFARGARGWGSGPGFSMFQQNPEDTALEAAADMFLNWVYRGNHPSGTSPVFGVKTDLGNPNPPEGGCNAATQESWIGFLNRNWGTPLAPLDALDDGRPGDVRQAYMEARITTIVQTKGW
ncbi:hypothetical protein HC928_15855 [bacterium]|nr:hypothetical protein [bacterium]